MRTPIDAIIFSAFEGEMPYYRSNIPDLEEVKLGFMSYFVGNYKGKKVALTHTGLGKVQATSSCHFAYANFEPKMALFTGTAGAVNPTLKTGSVVIGQRCVDADLFGIHEMLEGGPFKEALKKRHGEGLIPREYSGDERMVTAAVLSFEEASWKKVGCLATSDNFPSPKDKIESLRSAGIDTMDMEASAFHHAALLFGIPALAIRSVSNELDASGGDDAIASADIRTADRPAAIALEIIETLSF